MPPDGSTSVSWGRRRAIALTVKSRRIRSSSRLDAEDHIGLAGRAVVAVGAVGGDLDGLAGDLRADRAEGSPDVPVPLGDRLDDRQDLVGSRVGGEIEIVDLTPEEGVAHRSADESELVTGLRKCVRQSGHRGGGSQVAQSREGCRDALHDPNSSCCCRLRLPSAGFSRPQRRRIPYMVAESIPERRPVLPTSSVTRFARTRTAFAAVLVGIVTAASAVLIPSAAQAAAPSSAAQTAALGSPSTSVKSVTPEDGVSVQLSPTALSCCGRAKICASPPPSPTTRPTHFPPAPSTCISPKTP